MHNSWQNELNKFDKGLILEVFSAVEDWGRCIELKILGDFEILLKSPVIQSMILKTLLKSSVIEKIIKTHLQSHVVQLTLSKNYIKSTVIHLKTIFSLKFFWYRF